MSTGIKPNHPLLNYSQKSVLIGAGVIFCAVIVVAGISFFYGKRQGSKSLSAVPIINIAASPYQKVLGTQTANWEGKAVSVDSKKIVFTPTSGSQNGKNLAATIGADTQLMRWDVSQAVPGTQPGGNRTPISLSEFKSGATVYIQAAVDDQDQEEFYAIAISLLIKPKI